jgi:ParB family transcriptional regulator, chromosome partitioning protein
MSALHQVNTAAGFMLVRALRPSSFSTSIYGAVEDDCRDLVESIRQEGILVPLVVTPVGSAWEVISGHRRLQCARILGWESVPCEIRSFPTVLDRKRAVLEYNRQRRKTFSQMMREADAIESLSSAEAKLRRNGNLAQFPKPDHTLTDRRNSDDRKGRTDVAVAAKIGLGGKDLYRQARAVWRAARDGDIRAISSVQQVDAGVKTIHAAHKDLRRRGRFTTGFHPTPYDVWACRHDHAFGIPHPGSVPPALIAHALHYFSPTDGLVVDPMAGGGTTIDVSASMGRRCLAYDLHPVRPDIQRLDIKDGLPIEARECDLLFLDPPYHTMMAGRYEQACAADTPFTEWIAFLTLLGQIAQDSLKSGGHVALLLANQTEKDLPVGVGYIDHVFLGYHALKSAGLRPIRRISCPMSGYYLPQHVRRARSDGRLLGQVRDLLVMQKM